MFGRSGTPLGGGSVDGTRNGPVICWRLMKPSSPFVVASSNGQRVEPIAGVPSCSNESFAWSRPDQVLIDSCSAELLDLDTAEV